MAASGPALLMPQAPLQSRSLLLWAGRPLCPLPSLDSPLIMCGGPGLGVHLSAPQSPWGSLGLPGALHLAASIPRPRPGPGCTGHCWQTHSRAGRVTAQPSAGSWENNCGLPAKRAAQAQTGNGFGGWEDGSPDCPLGTLSGAPSHPIPGSCLCPPPRSRAQARIPDLSLGGAWGLGLCGPRINNHRGCAYQSLSCCPDLVLSQRQVGTPRTPATPDPMTALAFVLGTACCPSRPLTKAPPIPASMRGLPGPSWGTCRRLRGFGALWLPSWGDGRVDPQQFPARQREGGAPGKQGQAGAAPGWA